MLGTLGRVVSHLHDGLIDARDCQHREPRELQAAHQALLGALHRALLVCSVPGGHPRTPRARRGLRRVGEEDYARAAAAGGTSVFNPDKPWEYVRRELSQQHLFWRREVEQPCLFILAQLSSAPDSLDGDAPIGAPLRPLENGGTKRSAPAVDRSTKKAHASDRQHSLGGDGFFATNRRGPLLCAGFQDGSCTALNHVRHCTNTGRHAHQCAKCLSLKQGPSSQSPAWDSRAAQQPCRTL